MKGEGLASPTLFPNLEVSTPGELRDFGRTNPISAPRRPRRTNPILRRGGPPWPPSGDRHGARGKSPKSAERSQFSRIPWSDRHGARRPTRAATGGRPYRSNAWTHGKSRESAERSQFPGPLGGPEANIRIRADKNVRPENTVVQLLKRSLPRGGGHSSPPDNPIEFGRTGMSAPPGMLTSSPLN